MVGRIGHQQWLAAASTVQCTRKTITIVFLVNFCHLCHEQQHERSRRNPAQVAVLRGADDVRWSCGLPTVRPRRHPGPLRVSFTDGAGEGPCAMQAGKRRGRHHPHEQHHQADPSVAGEGGDATLGGQEGTTGQGSSGPNPQLYSGEPETAVGISSETGDTSRERSA